MIGFEVLCAYRPNLGVAREPKAQLVEPFDANQKWSFDVANTCIKGIPIVAVVLRKSQPFRQQLVELSLGVDVRDVNAEFLGTAFRHDS